MREMSQAQDISQKILQSLCQQPSWPNRCTRLAMLSHSLTPLRVEDVGFPQLLLILSSGHLLSPSLWQWPHRSFPKRNVCTDLFLPPESCGSLGLLQPLPWHGPARQHRWHLRLQQGQMRKNSDSQSCDWGRLMPQASFSPSHLAWRHGSSCYKRNNWYEFPQIKD